MQYTFSFWMVVLFGILNMGSFLIMLWDKVRSRKIGVKRISEGMLFFLATMFGSVGVYVGMWVFRHKTRKWYFIIGIPMLMAQNGVCLYALYRYLGY